LLLALDHIVADENSYFSVPAAKEGIIPGLANLRLARFMGRRKARQVILYGRQIWAHEPDGLLLFDEVIEPAKMDLAIERNIQRLSEPGVRENRHMLNLAEEPLEMFLHYAAEFALVQAELLYSEDVLGKVRGFAEA
jgi:thioesterase DpgC